MQLTDHIISLDDRIWVTTKYLEYLGLSLNTIKSGYKRYRSGRGQSWEPNLTEKLNNCTLIAYDSIPPEQSSLYGIPTIEEITSHLAIDEAEELEITQKSIPELWKPFYKVEDSIWFQTKYNVNGNRANGRDRAKELAIGCAILRMLNTYSTKSKIQKYTGFACKSDLYEAVYAYAKSYGEGGLYEIPTTYRWLRPKVKGWAEADKHNEDPRLVFNLERHLENDHALKFTSEHQAAFMMYYLNPIGDKKLGQKLPLLSCHRHYVNNMLHEFGIAEEECVDIGAIRAHFNKTRERKNLVRKARHGTTYFDSYVMPYIIGKSPEYSFSLVAGDGWMPGRTVITRRKIWNESKKDYVIQTRKRGINVWIWYDWKSKAILAHYLSPTETGEGIRKSFRDILSFWGIVPGSVMIDKKWTQQSDIQRLFEKADVHIESKKPYRPQGSIAERNNKEVNKYFREEDPFWVNMDRNTHTPEFRHNEDWVRNAAPVEEEEFLKTLHRIIHRYNNTPLKSLDGQTPLEVLQENINPLCRKVDPLESNFIFGDRRGPIKVSAYNFDIQIATKTYRYAIGFEIKNGKVDNNNDHIRFDRTVRPSERVLVYFDEKHMDTVDIYSYIDEDDPTTHRYMMTAVNQDLIRVNRSSFEQNPGQRKALQDRRLKIAKDHYDQQLREIAENAKNWGLLEEMEDESGDVRYDVTTLYQNGQAAEKERAANEVNTAYDTYHMDREYEEMVIVKDAPKPKQSVSSEEKRRLLEQQMKKLNEE